MPAAAPEREAARDLLAALALPALLLALAAFTGADAYELRLLALAGVYAVLVLGYQLIFGHAGAISLAQGAFFGLGAYGAALLALRFNLDLALTLPAAAALAALAASVAARPVLRLESHAFALATLALQQLAWIVAVNWEGVTGGANGLAGVPAAVAGMPVPRGWPLTLLAWAVFAVGALVVRRMIGGVVGLGLALMRENPAAAAASGIDIGRRRFIAFTASAALGGAAGSLYPPTLGTVSPEAVDFPVMVACLTMTVVGGRRRILGAAIGALLLVHLPEWLRVLEGQYLLAYGVALLAAVLFAPEGLADLALRALGPASPAPIPEAASALARVSSTPPLVDGPLLEIADLSKRFGGVEALARVSFDVRPGEIVGLIGPNGSGKTTLLNVVGGQERPDAGRVAFAGRDLGPLPPHERARLGIARSFQTPSLAPALSVLDNVALASGTPDTGLARARAEAAARLAACGLLDRAAALPSGLGPTQMRRVEIARALMLGPRLLLLDEPAAGLSPDDRQELAALLRALAASGVALLVIEHDMSFILPLADRIACLDTGRLIALGTPAEIAADPAVIAVYLGREA